MHMLLAMLSFATFFERNIPVCYLRMSSQPPVLFTTVAATADKGDTRENPDNHIVTTNHYNISYLDR